MPGCRSWTWRSPASAIAAPDHRRTPRHRSRPMRLPHAGHHGGMTSTSTSASTTAPMSNIQWLRFIVESPRHDIRSTDTGLAPATARRTAVGVRRHAMCPPPGRGQTCDRPGALQRTARAVPACAVEAAGVARDTGVAPGAARTSRAPGAACTVDHTRCRRRHRHCGSVAGRGCGSPATVDGYPRGPRNDGAGRQAATNADPRPMAQYGDPHPIVTHTLLNTPPRHWTRSTAP